MTEKEKDTIIQLRKSGYTYSKIADALNLSINTVKSFYRRNQDCNEQKCIYCGNPVVQLKSTRKKKFCSDNCRFKWWRTHGCDVERTAVYNFKCAYCDKPFKAYGNNHRKYCSHDCYIKARFGDSYDE